MKNHIINGSKVSRLSLAIHWRLSAGGITEFGGELSIPVNQYVGRSLNVNGSFCRDPYSGHRHLR